MGPGAQGGCRPAGTGTQWAVRWEVEPRRRQKCCLTPCSEGPGQPGASPPPLHACRDPLTPVQGRVGRDSRGWAAHAPALCSVPRPARPRSCGRSELFLFPGAHCPRGDLVTGRASGEAGGTASPRTAAPLPGAASGDRTEAGGSATVTPPAPAEHLAFHRRFSERPQAGGPPAVPRDRIRHLGGCGITFICPE